MTASRPVLTVISMIGLLAAPLAAGAQPARVARVGYLHGGSFSRTDPIDGGLLRGLREHGYAEGKNLVIEFRSAGGRNEAFPALAAELVRLEVDVIVAHSTPATLAAKQATTTIPIVLLNVADPVGVGLVASLARPGGNVTGVSSQAADFTGKLLELANETVLRLTRVAAITTPTNPALATRVKELEAAASALDITPHPVG